MKRSKTLQRYLDLGLYEAKRSGNINITADAAFLALLKEGMSHASHVLRKLLKDWEVYQLRMRIERDAAKSIARHTPDTASEAEKAMGAIVQGVQNVCNRLSANPSDPGQGSEMVVYDGTEREAVAGSGHFLIWLLGNRELISARALEMYGVTEEKVVAILAALPADEDHLHNMEILDRLSRLSVIRIEQPGRRAAADDEEEDFGESGGNVGVKSRKRAKTALEQLGVNLSDLALEGRIDPVVGREKEIERLIQILGRRKKNNPILIGEAGVGKTAIVEGLALRIASGDVPQSLARKEVFSLDVASLVAGTKYRGQFEERIKAMLEELRTRDNVILFIDEIHTITGAGSTQGSLDTANILKPALARGELQCIGATTLDEYRENIETDSALERRFQKIIVEPTTAAQTLEILHNIKSHYEKHHGVRYTDEALKACVELTERYVSDRNFPDKAIDVMDEAGSKARLFAAGEPEMLRELEKALAEAEEAKALAVAAQAFDKAADARVRSLALQERIAECHAGWQREANLNPAVLGAKHIEEVITSMTGIPVEKVSQDEKSRLAGMEAHLSGRVIGQPAAIAKIVKSIQRSRTGLKDPGKPIGVFMFVGPTGVGKTHLAKELARWMFDREDALVRIDMSEYSEKHNVSRMIGSPPGYVGYNEGGQLTETVRRQPYSVILFDEIEKAHPDVFNIMLQIFDEGQLTDGSGRKVDFRNTVIIMTSNAGSRKVARRGNAVGYLTSGKEQIEAANRESDYREGLESMFAPEFINRIDDIVVFNTLTGGDVIKIIDLELSSLNLRTKALGYGLSVSARAKKAIAATGYQPRYGVRSLKRTILENVEEAIAHKIVCGELAPGDTICVDAREGRIEVSKQRERLGQNERLRKIG